MSILRWVVLGSLLAACGIGQPAQAANFGIFVGCNTGCGDPISINNQPSPVGDSLAGVNGAGSTAASAFATYGSVGAGSSAVSSSGTVGESAGGTAFFADTVLFAKTNPLAPDQFNVSLNLSFAGLLNAAAIAGSNAQASVNVTVGLFTPNELHIVYSGDGGFLLTSDFSGTGTIVPGAAGFSSLLATTLQSATVGTVSFSLLLVANSGARFGGASATSDFSNTLEVPTGIDVFNLPEGYTANAGNWLVNNRFVGAETPLPAALPLFATGLGALGLLGWRRKKKAALAA